MEGVDTVAGSSNQVTRADDVYPSLFLRVWIFHQLDLGFGCEILDVRNLYEVVDPLASEFEVEARVLKCGWQLDDGLAKLVDLLLRRDLENYCISIMRCMAATVSDPTRTLRLTMTWISLGS